jgi:hypothetical protein
VSDIALELVDSLKALDPDGREADIGRIELPQCSSLLPTVLFSGMLLDTCRRRLGRAIG